MFRIGNGGRKPLERLRLVASRFIVRALVSSPVSSSTISVERMKRIQTAFAQLDSAGNNPDKIGMLMTSLLSQTMPGKRLARIDLLRYTEQGQVFSSRHIEAPDGGIGFSGAEMDVTKVITSRSLRLNGDPDFIAAMQAMNTGKEFAVNGENWEQFLGIPLLGRDNKVLGSLVLSNRSWKNVTPITPEDKETFRQFAKKLSALLAT